MPSVQEFFKSLTEKAAQDLEAALDRLPADKREWKPKESSRSAMDQFAECAILNGRTAQLIAERTWGTQESMEEFEREKALLSKDYAGVKAKMKENLPIILQAISKVSDDELAISIDMPWGPMTVGQIVTYPYWNMSYHEGQINYIASMLEVPA